MKKPSNYEEVFIESLARNLRIRIFTPEEMEILESIPERDRAGELIFQGVYDCDEFMRKLSAVVGSELVGMMVDSRTKPLLARLRSIKADILEAIYRVNRLRWVEFREAEDMLVGNRSYQFRIDDAGRLLLSEENSGDLSGNN